MSAPVAVILAAGQGTRMRSAVPKLMHPLCGRPMIAWAVAAARGAGAERIVVVDSPERRLHEVLGDDVDYAIQRDPRGTADALRAAAELIDPRRPVLVLAGDVPLIRPQTLSALLSAHRRDGAAATMATAVLGDPIGYGRVIRAPDGTVERVVETKASGDATDLERAVREVNTGIFVFDGATLVEALEQVRADNAQGELYLPDVLPILRLREHTTMAFELDDPSETLGVNDRVALAAVRALAQRRIHEELMRSGVTIVLPEATVIDVGVSVGTDSVIEPFSSLLGTTCVGAQATIGSHTTLIDCEVGDGARVIRTHAVEAWIGAQVSVGPFAYLRPGTRLRTRSKVGTFVEVKNSDLGEGSKIPHLSYIGDAEIGEGTNLGAATITANYDGFRKHRTTIGSGVKTSVDTTLIAPVSIGNDAYTAAGSVIGKDIPPGALGVARAQQRNIEGYSERRQERSRAEAQEGKADQPDSAERPNS